MIGIKAGRPHEGARPAERGLWYRTPGVRREGNFRAAIYLRPLAIWAIEEALRRSRAAG
jgi:hypothetical protein